MGGEDESDVASEVQRKRAVCGRNGHNDSLGHCSTYCNNTLMDPVSNLIIHQVILDVRQA